MWHEMHKCVHAHTHCGKVSQNNINMSRRMFFAKKHSKCSLAGNVLCNI